MHENLKFELTVVLSVLFFGFGLSFASLSSADALRGFVETKAGVRSLMVPQENGSALDLAMTGATPQVQDGLNRLKNGDYLTARGSTDESVKPPTVKVDAIESLGLQAVVGLWTSSESEIYDFQDFSRLDLYTPVQKDNEQKDNEQSSDMTRAFIKAGEFQYSIVPDQGSRYTMFLSGPESVRVASMEFKKHRLVLKMIDPKSGHASPEITLSPLALAPQIMLALAPQIMLALAPQSPLALAPSLE